MQDVFAQAHVRLRPLSPGKGGSTRAVTNLVAHDAGSPKRDCGSFTLFLFLTISGSDKTVP